MLSNLQKNKELNSIISKFYRENKSNILDIILFGSVVRGKDNPNDIDILVLFKDKENLDVAYELKKKLSGVQLEIQIITKNYNSLFDAGFKARESVLSEGFSLVRKEFISVGLGYRNKILIKYSLQGFSQSQRMQFQYALHGRDKKSGIFKKLKLLKFSDSVILCPVENSEEVKTFFNSWKIKYEEFPVLLPARIL